MNGVFKNLRIDQFLFVVVLVLLFIAPSLFGIFLFNREYFIELDVIKLLLLGISVSTPYYFANFLPVAGISSHYQGEREVDTITSEFLIHLWTMVAMCFSLYSGAAITYLFTEQNFSSFLLLSSLVQAIVFVGLMIWILVLGANQRSEKK